MMDAQDPAVTIKQRFFASYAIALTLLLIVSGGAHIYILSALEDEREAAEVVNLSGAQRMLSQRMLALSLSLSEEGGRTPERVERMAITANRFLAAHGELRDYALNHPMERQLKTELIELFDGPGGISERVEAFAEIAERAEVEALDQSELATLEAEAYGALFEQLNTAVNLFQRDAEDGIQGVANAHMIQLLLILLVLTGEAIFIFWPLTRRLLAAMQVETEARRQAEDALNLQQSLDASRARFMSMLDTEFVAPLKTIEKRLDTSDDIDTDALPGILQETRAEVVRTRQRVGSMVEYFENWRREEDEAGELNAA